MSTSVLLACGLNNQKLDPFTFLRQENDVDGSFLISCILGQRLKVPQTKTLLVCLHHTYQHYSNAGIRLGFNLNAAIEKGSLQTIEPLLEIPQQLYKSAILTSSSDTLISNFYQSVETKITELVNSKSTSITVIFDDLSALINLGVSEELVVTFCRYINNLILAHSGKLSVVIKLNTSNLYDLLCNNLEDMANAEIRIKKLKSGTFKEVDGRLVSIKHDVESNAVIEKKMLYKVNDRNIKIFAPGEVGVQI